ncbi:Lrp/AsnC family leucine-responsive transcriptional regulator [Massilia sp. UYP32]|jgi:Lrp/AsnC family leucine-responsive transcriptional regulator|uniref:Lrp/AsnC family transcriptional regulator n=1 Tax=Massilia TaxID=149698 RepID=UPI0008F5B789|nr:MULTISPECIES: Lrp/AsnC family transcriptional regulator [Massilia]QYG03372.1 Lrp/AsnC family transcriptional regulator [Massilia sp. NP310]
MNQERKSFDATDLTILGILLRDSRTPLQEISAAVGLSTTSCWNRIKRMTDSGALQGYTVKVDLPSLGYHDQLIVQVTLDSHSEETLYEFGRALESIPEVLEASLISGDYDYFLRIAVKDTRDYERLLRERLYKIPGIRHSKSSFVLRTLKKVDTPLTA